MPHYAELDSNNIVQRVIVADSKEWCDTHLPIQNGRWTRTYYNTPGKTYAGTGFEYITDADNYRPVQPFPSWTFDHDTWTWNAPVPYPRDATIPMQWNEEAQTWCIRP